MSILSCRSIEKRYGSEAVLRGIDLDLNHGEAYALLGESGSGKTTLARILCGLDRADAGQFRLSPGAKVMLLPQDFVIWPHLTVRRNVQLGCRSSRGKESERIAEWLERLGITALADRRADALSYGQQQRVALARAFCFEPDLLLLDEPLAHLDTPGRRALVEDLKRAFAELALSVLWITHDAREAFSIGTKIAVLDRGRVGQCAAPHVLYRQPATVGIGLLTGDLNVYSPMEWGKIEGLIEGTQTLVVSDGQTVCFRPEAVHCVPNATGPWRVSGAVFIGTGWHLNVRAGDVAALRVWIRDPIDAGTRVRLRLDSGPQIVGT